MKGAAAAGAGLVLVAGVAGLLWIRPAPVVRAVHPATGDVPANFLRLYIDFSEPMGGDDVFAHVRLLDASGRPLPDSLRELEFWSRKRTRLMVYVHPGRVKTGLAMGGEFGPVLEQGKRYALEITPGMKSERGRAVREGFRRELRVGAPQTSRPDLSRWLLEARPERVELECDVWMDQAGLEDWLKVEGVAGRWEIDGRRATFLPEKPLVPGAYMLVADARMEDVCGNSFQRSFETRPDAARPEDLPTAVSRRFVIP
ncbi:MAG: hypothetical protein HY293_02920 [Planctomycetes bacterium]|nr:hypothetical protein [Planctomycetota bacterium]